MRVQTDTQAKLTQLRKNTPEKGRWKTFYEYHSDVVAI